MHTPRLTLPYIQTNQAQKEVTHANALNRLDALTQGVVESHTLTAPHTTPLEGQVWIVAASPTGAWAGQAQKIAQFLGGVWQFITPLQGWRFLSKADNRLYYYNGTAWVKLFTDTADSVFRLMNYTVATLPAASGHTGGLVFVSDASGGSIPAFSDGTDWRRVDTRGVVS